MALDDVVNAGEKYKAINVIAGSVRKDLYNPRNVPVFLEYASQAGEPLIPEALVTMQEELSNNPVRLRQMTEISAAREQRNLIDSVSQNYQEVVNDLSEEKVRDLALEVPDEGKNFYEIFEKLRRGDEKGVKEDYIAVCKNEVWKDFIKSARPDFVRRFVKVYVGIKQREFLEKYSKEVTRDGEKVKELDYGKLRNYITDTVGKYDNEEIKEQVYLATGRLYLDIEDERDERDERDRH